MSLFKKKPQTDLSILIMHVAMLKAAIETGLENKFQKPFDQIDQSDIDKYIVDILQKSTEVYVAKPNELNSFMAYISLLLNEEMIKIKKELKNERYVN